MNQKPKKLSFFGFFIPLPHLRTAQIFDIRAIIGTVNAGKTIDKVHILKTLDALFHKGCIELFNKVVERS